MKHLKKFFIYFLYLLGFIWWAKLSITMMLNANILVVVFGMLSLVMMVAAFIILIIREILYWTKKDEPDGWEDDLTNQ